MLKEFDIVIGLEIHAQLQTQSKCFSSASTNFGKGHNENVTAICAGFPGTLPVLNEKVVDLAIKAGLAFNCDIKKKSSFARKQYFYPDMPKGYQITQYKEPIAENGYVEFYLDGKKRKVRLERAHIEEDAGKSTHFGEYTLINLNRAGIPLLEIVSKPEIDSPSMAAAYAKSVRQILRFTGVCDGNLEEGSLRCDCNVSIKSKGAQKLGVKVELKNINSFRFIEKALEYEIQRQVQCLQMGEEITQETRLYDSVKNKTFSMRKKEEANDYRYFPDPDLLPLVITTEKIRDIKQSLPESPIQRLERFMNDFGLSFEESELLLTEKSLADYFESIQNLVQDARLTSVWISGEFLRLFNETPGMTHDTYPLSIEQCSEILKTIKRGEISVKIAKEIFEEVWRSGKNPMEIIKEKGLSQISDIEAIKQIIEQALIGHEDKVQAYKQGKEKIFGFFIGQVMKLSRGQANPEIANQLLREYLKK